MDKYEELQRIGKGAEGTVFLARIRETGAMCVIKKIYVRSNSQTAWKEANILSSVG
jgi:serine/threonine protein kinase